MVKWSDDVSALRAMAGQMSDAALEALTSRGLVRRALSDAAAGKVELRGEEDGAEELAVDGETVRLTADGIAKSSCSCPAPGICRHRLAAIVHLRSAAPADAPSIDWRSVFDAMTPAAIARFAGKAGWQKILSRDETPASVEDRGSSFVVQGAEHSVVFLPEGAGGCDQQGAGFHAQDCGRRSSTGGAPRLRPAVARSQ